MQKTFILAVLLLSPVFLAAAEPAVQEQSAPVSTDHSQNSEHPPGHNNEQAAQTTEESTWDKVGDSVVETSGKTWEATKHTSKEAWEATTEMSSKAWGATKSGSSKAWKTTKETTGEAWEATKEGTEKAWDATKEAVSGE